MYTTQPYSIFKSSPETALEPPQKGPSSGYVVLDNEEAEATCCWGTCEDTRIYNLPFPQNRILTVNYTQAAGTSVQSYLFDVLFIPVEDQPLSSNLYYVIHAEGKNGGKLSTCSKEEDMTTCCFCKHIKDADPKEFDQNDIYQQIEVVPCKKKGYFTAKSVAPDGFAPWLFRQKYWAVHASKPKVDVLTEALGFNKALYQQKLKMDFPISAPEASTMAIGKWYSPFMFIKEEISLKDQVKRSAYYEISLEQFWEQVYIAENLYDTDKSVNVQAFIQANRVLLNGEEAQQDEAKNKNGIKWFKPLNSGEKVGISAALWERFRWEQEKRGWVSDDVNINKVEFYEGVQTWKKYCFYVLVERFTVKRMDGSLALTVDFKHTKKVQNKWE